MKELLKVSVVAFAITLAVVVGNRLSAEATAVIVGLVFGVLASVPLSLIVLLIVRRTERREPPPRWESYPPVVVIQPGAQPQAQPPYLSPFAVPLATPNQREFRIVGEEDENQLPRS
jgi:hypothetical protein